MLKNRTNSSNTMPKARPIERIISDKNISLFLVFLEMFLIIFLADLEAFFRLNFLFLRLLILFTGKLACNIKKVIIREKFDLQGSVFAVATDFNLSTQSVG